MTRLPSGIYKITNIKSDKIYVGQSENVFKRRDEHFQALSKDRHDNVHLQKDWNESGGLKNFRWEVIEYCALTELNSREKYWIDYYNSYWPNGYNQGWQPYKRKVKTVKTYKQTYKQRKYKKRS